jgi:hypothetical protein
MKLSGPAATGVGRGAALVGEMVRYRWNGNLEEKLPVEAELHDFPAAIRRPSPEAMTDPSASPASSG